MSELLRAQRDAERQLHDDMEHDAMVDTINELERERDELLAASPAAEVCPECLNSQYHEYECSLNRLASAAMRSPVLSVPPAPSKMIVEDRASMIAYQRAESDRLNKSDSSTEERSSALRDLGVNSDARLATSTDNDSLAPSSSESPSERLGESDLPPAPAVEDVPLTQNEDELPIDMTQEEYDRWFAQSEVIDGVRMGPKFPPAPEQKRTVVSNKSNTEKITAAQPASEPPHDESLWTLANEIASAIYKKRVYLRGVHKTPVVAIGEMAGIIEPRLREVHASRPAGEQVFTRPECPFHYCDQENGGICKERGYCRHRSPQMKVPTTCVQISCSPPVAAQQEVKEKS